MYLKTLEIIGFKSFADKTRLEFEPGMVAIVGPNGCGKSNVSDAIRWVLGEQRPSALRCAKMHDIIFNGSDNRKPLGMAEVSLTFSDCEEKLGVEYHEITITRRVFRSGEGQYFLNKTACRLKDIQRLFMGTGIGTTSYSVMAQGQIDAILSSKPEDRRAVFEEAAGITKFKADRKEALRKLAETDANLLRLTDVIREVKRQLGSMQRQVGKAKRYRELKDELRGLDLYVARHKLDAFDTHLADLDAQLANFESTMAEHQAALTAAEQNTAASHEELLRIEQQISAFQESATQTEAKLLRAQEVIRVNEQRIQEYENFSQRDTREINENHRQITLLKEQRDTLAAQLDDFTARHDASAGLLEELQYQHDEYRANIDQTRRDLQILRDEALQRERRAAQIQSQLAELESAHSAKRLQRERISAEHDQLDKSLHQLDASCAETMAQLLALQNDEANHAQTLQTLEDELAETTFSLQDAQQQRHHLNSGIMTTRARLETLSDRKELEDGLPEGNRQILDPANPLHLPHGALLGAVLDHINVPAELRLAVEAALRPWIDALLVDTPATASAILDQLASQPRPAAARLLIAATNAPAPHHSDAPFPRLLDALTVSDTFRAAAEHLLGHVLLAPDTTPLPAAPNHAIVTPRGILLHPHCAAELWNPDTASPAPLARRNHIQQLTTQLATLEPQLNTLTTTTEALQLRQSTLTDTLKQTRAQLDHARRLTAGKNGEVQTLQRDADRTRLRLSSLTAERDHLLGQTSEQDTQYTALSDELQHLISTRELHVERSATRSAELEHKETAFSDITTRLTEARISANSLKQQIDHARQHDTSLASRVDELTRIIQGRSQGIASYDEGIQRLSDEITTLTADLGTLQEERKNILAIIEDARYDKLQKRNALTAAETALAQTRATFETARDKKSSLDIDHAQQTMLRQNTLEKIYTDYGLTPDQFLDLPAHKWPDDTPPAIPDAEIRIAELNTKILDLGPVNLVAIEEYKELEDRHTHLTTQEADLLASKEQVTLLIQQLNTTSGDLFRQTFEQANANFGAMFAKLFNGGEARLVLIENPEDPLECGVDIIARPPGKRPQTISLLSGGERTMTAVSLLFSIYLIKPSPFAMLDELDAALDDSNIGRFVNALREFLTQSQFLIITHSQHTIAAADIVYGVTMPEKGISKTISIKLKEIGRKNPGLGTPKPDTPEPSPEKPKRSRKPQEPLLPLPDESPDATVVPVIDVVDVVDVVETPDELDPDDFDDDDDDDLDDDDDTDDLDDEDQ